MKQKLLVAALALTLVLCIAMGVTLAWLTAKTDTIVNTFVIGNIGLTLTEAAGDVDDNDENDLTNSYKMAPGAEITKDPKLTVSAGSEQCYVFFKVEEGHNTFDETKAIISYTAEGTWTELSEGVYYQIVDNTESDVVLQLFADNKVSVNNDLTTEDIETDGEGQMVSPTLTITGYAIQKSAVANFDGTDAEKAAEAWRLLNPTP